MADKGQFEKKFKIKLSNFDEIFKNLRDNDEVQNFERELLTSIPFLSLMTPTPEQSKSKQSVSLKKILNTCNNLLTALEPINAVASSQEFSSTRDTLTKALHKRRYEQQRSRLDKRSQHVFQPNEENINCRIADIIEKQPGVWSVELNHTRAYFNDPIENEYQSPKYSEHPPAQYHVVEVSDFIVLDAYIEDFKKTVSCALADLKQDRQYRNHTEKNKKEFADAYLSCYFKCFREIPTVNKNESKKVGVNKRSDVFPELFRMVFGHDENPFGWLEKAIKDGVNPNVLTLLKYIDDSKTKWNASVLNNKTEP